MLKILFTLDGAGTAQHLSTRIDQLITYLDDANNTARGGDHHICRVYSNFTYIQYHCLLNSISFVRVDEQPRPEEDERFEYQTYKFSSSSAR